MSDALASSQPPLAYDVSDDNGDLPPLDWFGDMLRHAGNRKTYVVVDQWSFVHIEYNEADDTLDDVPAVVRLLEHRHDLRRKRRQSMQRFPFVRKVDTPTIRDRRERART